jgi:DHA1 family multidrug resistance protein-like MFS transporter
MGVIFLCLIIGAAIGVVVYCGLVYYIFEPYTLKNGIGNPEFRLIPGIVASALAPVGMFIFGYASKSDISWVAPTVGITLYAATSFVVRGPVLQFHASQEMLTLSKLVNVIFIYLPISYPRYAASVFASNGKDYIWLLRVARSDNMLRTFPQRHGVRGHPLFSAAFR